MGFGRALPLAAWMMAMAAAAAGAGQAGSESGFGGRLYRSVFSGGAGVLTPADLAGVEEPLKSRLMTYLERRAAFRSRYSREADTLADVRADAKRRVLERSIVALVDAPDIERTAAAIVAEAPIAGEWDGRPEGPLAEASFAEDLLKRDPASPLAPWLYVFIADRQRIAFEACEKQENQECMRAAARKYRTLVSRARSVEDPAIRALVRDLEGLPSLYVRSASHPRDYDPDT